MTSTDDLRRVVSEAEGILKTVNRSGALPGCMIPDGAEPCRAFQEQDEAIRAVLALFHAALASSPTPDGVIKERVSDGRRPDGPRPSHSVSSPSGSPAAVASIPGADAVDFDGLNALFAKIPNGPWDAQRDTGGCEIRQIDTDPTNKHHWPVRLCRSVPGVRSAYDDAVFHFLAGVLNAWPQIAAARSEEAEIERILAMSGQELDARLRLDGRDPDDVLALANYAFRTATMLVALDTISSQYVENRGDMTAEEALAAIKTIADRARDQRAEREDAQRPRPEAASPVVDATSGGEAPGSDEQTGQGARRPTLREMTDAELLAESAGMDLQLAAFRAAMDECDGCAGSPGESLYEAADALDIEIQRRGLVPSAPRPSQREG